MLHTICKGQQAVCRVETNWGTKENINAAYLTRQLQHNDIVVCLQVMPLEKVTCTTALQCSITFIFFTFKF